MKIFKRLLTTPFVFGLILISHNWEVLRRIFYFIKYGGEFINYRKNDSKTVLDLYNILKINLQTKI